MTHVQLYCCVRSYYVVQPYVLQLLCSCIMVRHTEAVYRRADHVAGCQHR